VEDWLRSYKIEELMEEGGWINKDVLSTLPPPSRRMGLNPHTMPHFTPLDLPRFSDFAVETCDRGSNNESAITKVAGKYLGAVINRFI
jgi:phosphoketolase